MLCIMKKRIFGRKFKRDANERKALFKNLLTSLVIHERIRTSEAKAKAIKSSADKLITSAKKGKAGTRALESKVNGTVVPKLINDLAPRFAKRNGGYTRIVKVGKKRVADNASMAFIEWTEKKLESKVEGSESSREITKKTVKTPAKKSVKVENKSAKTKAKKIPVVKPAPKKEQPKKDNLFKQIFSRQKKG